MLKVENLRVSYGAIEALRGVSFEVAERSTVAMIGANGAGKSTIMRALSGLVQSGGGDIRFNGQSITKKSAPYIARRGIAQVPEGRQIFPNLTVIENLRLGGFWLSSTRYAELLEKVLAMFPRLRERSGQLGGLLSGGEQQMLAIGRALMSEPTLLLLDEPSMGLAPAITDEIFRIIANLRSEGMTILVVEQSVNRALAAADYVYVLELGKIVTEGIPADVMQKTDLAQLYLGQIANEERRVVNG